MARKTAHIISHTHWDREWYMPYEKHHIRLVALMDTLLELLDRDPEFKSFHLDGQTIVLEDYLQVRPENRDKIIRFCQEGRLRIGPWYILQDEFLTSSEANVRNLQIGHRDAKQYGSISRIGYFPDSFGNMGQAPQFLREAGIGNAVFGRGVKAVGANNAIDTSAALESPFSELEWESPDGSVVQGILFANWYHNGMEIPVDEAEAKIFWDRALAAVEQFASTDHLLFMNGCDHQPVQTDLTSALKTARKLYPDIDFIHSNFDDYVEQVKRNAPSDLKKITGELRGQHTDGWWTLANTASARVYLKQMNQRGTTLLEKVAEPIASIAHLLGKPYPHHLFTYAWKTLMQNHPHDSICGCSVDEVHREMVTRFEKSRQFTESIVEDSIQLINSHIDTNGFLTISSEALPFAVYNSSGWKRSSTITVRLEAHRTYFHPGQSPAEIVDQLKKVILPKGYVVDEDGISLPCTVQNLGVKFDYKLPMDKFRRPYLSIIVEVTIEAIGIPALGYKTYAWVPSDDGHAYAEENASLIVNGSTMSNANLTVSIAEDGTLTVTDKISPNTYYGLCAYEDVGDIGNEYIFMQPVGENPITTMGLPAQIRVVEDTPYRATFEITHKWKIPARAEDLLEDEKLRMVTFMNRKSQRVKDMVPLEIRTWISLERNGKGVLVKSSFSNQAKDHRIRMLFPTDIQTTTVRADSIFEVAERAIEPAAEWVNPSHSQHQHAFVDISSHNSGLTIGNKGLQEYEALRDNRRTIAVTLLRSVGELGDWGVFPTPEAQCLGDHTAELMIIPHQGGDHQFDAYKEAYQFQIPLQASQIELQEGILPPTFGLLKWEGSTLAFSSLTINEERGDLMARWYNMAKTETPFSLNSQLTTGVPYSSNILEDRSNSEATGDSSSNASSNALSNASSNASSNTVKRLVGGSKIITLGFENK